MTEDSGDGIPGWIHYLAQGLPMGMSNLPETVKCRVCGGMLDVHQRVTTQVCGRPECQEKLLHGRIENAQKHIDARAEGRDGPRPRAYARAGPVALEAIRRTGAVRPSDAVAAVVPFNGQGLAPLPARRRAEFEAHIGAVVDEAFGGAFEDHLAAPDEHFAGRTDIEPDDPPAAAACCAACRGYCCVIGNGTKAFLDAGIMAYYRHRNPGATPAEVREAYLSRIPDISSDEGCVYQGAEGCTLPRTMRANICNSYRCTGQERVLEQLETKSGAHVALVALATWHWNPSEIEEGEELHRVLTIGPDGKVVLHGDIALPPLADAEE